MASTKRLTKDGRPYGEEPVSQETMRLKCMDQLATDVLPYTVMFYNDRIGKTVVTKFQTYDEAMQHIDLVTEEGFACNLFLQIRPMNDEYQRQGGKKKPGPKRGRSKYDG